jgi:hypothetical protein
MSKLLALLYLGYALVSLTLAQSDEVCSVPAGTQSTCVCQTDSGRTIDLRPLAKKDGTAMYVVFIANTSSDNTIICYYNI